MEFTINREVFLAGIQKTLGIVEKKTTMPILNNLLLKATEDRMMIMATDMEIGMVYNYETKVVSEGEITVSARKLYEMVREIQGDTIHLVKDEKNVVIITCNKVVYRILGIPADDYPVIDTIEGLDLFPVNGLLLKDLLQKTHFSVSNDETRKHLTGVFMEIEKIDGICTMRCISTDSHRLSLASSQEVFRAGCPSMEHLRDIIIPKKGVTEIIRIMDDNENDHLSVGFVKGFLILKNPRTFLKVSLIDADYPEYRRVIPADKGMVIKINREYLLHLLRRMCVLYSEKYNGVVMVLSHKRVSFNSINNDVGEANDEIEVEYYGEERHIGYNVLYLLDAVEAIDEDTIDWEINEEMRPTILRGSGNDNYFCIIMPLKI